MPSLWQSFDFPSQNEPLPSKHFHRNTPAPSGFHFRIQSCIPGSLILICLPSGRGRYHILLYPHSTWTVLCYYSHFQRCLNQGREAKPLVKVTLPFQWQEDPRLPGLKVRAASCTAPGFSMSVLRTLDEHLLMWIDTKPLVFLCSSPCFSVSNVGLYLSWLWDYEICFRAIWSTYCAVPLWPCFEIENIKVACFFFFLC